MKINTKVVFEWNPKSKQYEEIYCDSYEHDGEVAECQVWGTDPSRRRTDYNYPNPERQIGMPSLMGPILGRGQNWVSQMVGGIPGTEELSASIGPPTTTWTGPPTRPNVGSSYGQAEPSMLGDVEIGSISMGGPSQHTAVGGTTEQFAAGLSGPSGTWTGGGGAATDADPAKTPGLFERMKTAWGGVSPEQKAGGLGALAGGFLGYRQAKSQQKGLGAAIKEIDPLKGKFMGEHKRHLGIAESYRPGGRYSQYMAGQIMGQAAESAGQESQRMIASGITSPSMMRAMARQSRTRAQHALPGMELQLSQMALPYEQMGAQSLTQYGGVVEQLASLKGARAAIDPTSAAIKGGMEGIMAAGQMMSSFMPG